MNYTQFLDRLDVYYEDDVLHILFDYAMEEGIAPPKIDDYIDRHYEDFLLEEIKENNDDALYTIFEADVTDGELEKCQTLKDLFINIQKYEA